jgi:hypothetical protein
MTAMSRCLLSIATLFVAGLPRSSLRARVAAGRRPGCLSRANERIGEAPLAIVRTPVFPAVRARSRVRPPGELAHRLGGPARARWAGGALLIGTLATVTFVCAASVRDELSFAEPACAAHRTRRSPAGTSA